MAGVYISFPFCDQKCTYCNFASGVFSRDLERDYLQALGAELRSYAWQWTPETLYFGGGTPGKIGAADLRELIGPIPGRPWAEATIEAAPGGITPERVEAWRECGLNRVSLGVQSFVQDEIRRTGRKHTAETVATETALLREAGLSNFNVDLIAGLPGQTAASWRASLDWIERLDAPHVSVYMLEVDEDSRLGREILAGGERYAAGDVPDEDATTDLYEAAVERLAGMGIRRYEISNFARPGYESRHNLKYWRREPYAGFGADAHSFDANVRQQNVESPGAYVARWREGRAPLLEQTAAQESQEHFFVGLRLMEGIRPRAAEWERFEAPIRRFVEAGLLETDGETLRLTPRGVLLSNEVFQEFVNA